MPNLVKKLQLRYIPERRETLTSRSAEVIKIKTIRQIKSRIWEIKGGKYTKTLAKIWVEGITRIRDIRGNVLPKFI